MKHLLTLFWTLSLVSAYQSVPLLVASHKVVPGLKKELGNDNSQSHEVGIVTNMIKKLITECSSDEYVIINQPGLTYLDLTSKRNEEWPFIRKYLMLASTVIGVPWLDDPLDLDFIEKYIIKSCDAETISVVNDDENEVVPYYDTRTRVLRINLSPLPSDLSERYHTIREHDELIRKIIRKLPSPHYTIILTSESTTEIHPIPPNIVQANPEKYELFNDITNDPSRANEVERNLNFHKVDPDWIENKHTNKRYLKNKKKDEIHFFENEVWAKHEKMVSTIVVMIVTLFAVKIWNFFSLIKQKLAEQKKPVIVAHNKSE